MTELSDTVSELLAAFDTAEVPGAPIAVEAEIETLVELRFQVRDGHLIALAAPPASRFVSGVMAPVHRMRVRATRDAALEVESP